MQTIVWDVDDVLNGLMREWFEREWKREGPACAVQYDDLTANPPHEVLGVTLKEYLESLDRFRVSQKAWEMAPNREVVQWFRDHGTQFRHIALTARPLNSAGPAAEWVMRHFGDYIRVFAVVPCRGAPDEPVYDRRKSEFLEWWGRGDILVDDSPENVAAAERIGVQGVLFPQPWNGARERVRAALERINAVAA